MPNYNLTDSVKRDIMMNANNQAVNRYNHMKGPFPLTTVEVQGALMDADTLERFQELEARSHRVIQKQTKMAVRLDREDFPGLQRSCQFLLILTDSVFVTKPYTQWVSSVWHAKGHDSDTARFTAGTLSDDARERLVKWANNAVREARLRTLAATTVASEIQSCKTVADVLARWPLLATLVSPNDMHMARWRSRFRNPITDRYLDKYRPGATWFEVHKKHMAAAELVINTGLLMGDYTADETKCQADLTAWERLPNDPPGT